MGLKCVCYVQKYKIKLHGIGEMECLELAYFCGCRLRIFFPLVIFGKSCLEAVVQNLKPSSASMSHTSKCFLSYINIIGTRDRSFELSNEDQISQSVKTHDYVCKM